MKRAFRAVLGQGLDDADSQPILCLLKVENRFTLAAALFLFPMKNLFDVRVLDNRDPLIEIEKPLNYVGNRIEIDIA